VGLIGEEADSEKLKTHRRIFVWMVVVGVAGEVCGFRAKPINVPIDVDHDSE